MSEQRPESPSDSVSMIRSEDDSADWEDCLRWRAGSVPTSPTSAPTSPVKGCAGSVPTSPVAPDTSSDLTRNWLTATGPPAFSRRGKEQVVMPLRSPRAAASKPPAVQAEQAENTSPRLSRRMSLMVLGWGRSQTQARAGGPPASPERTLKRRMSLGAVGRGASVRASSAFGWAAKHARKKGGAVDGEEGEGGGEGGEGEGERRELVLRDDEGAKGATVLREETVAGGLETVFEEEGEKRKRRRWAWKRFLKGR